MPTTARRRSPSPRAAALALLAALAAVATGRAAGAQEGDGGWPSLRVADRGGEFVVEVGPLELPARAGHEAVRQPPTLRFAVPVAGWLRGYAVEMHDGAGRRVPQRTLHHLNLIATNQRDLFSNAMLRVGAAGAETAAITLPRVVGFRGARGDTLAMTIMLHNPTDSAYRDVTLRVRVPYTRAGSRVGAVTVYPLSVAIGPKDRPNVFDLPPGRSEHWWEGSPAVDGRVLGLSGHLHRYGVALRLEDRTAGKVLWEVRPERGADGEIRAIPVSRFVLGGGKRIRRDHVYRLTAVYENPEGRTIPEGGMGVMGGVLRLPRGGRWPALDRAHPDYVSDARTLFGPPDSAAAHHHRHGAGHGAGHGVPPR